MSDGLLRGAGANSDSAWRPRAFFAYRGGAAGIRL